MMQTSKKENFVVDSEVIYKLTENLIKFLFHYMKILVWNVLNKTCPLQFLGNLKILDVCKRLQSAIL